MRASRWETSGLFLGMVTIKSGKVIPSGSKQEWEVFCCREPEGLKTAAEGRQAAREEPLLPGIGVIRPAEANQDTPCEGSNHRESLQNWIMPKSQQVYEDVASYSCDQIKKSFHCCCLAIITTATCVLGQSLFSLLANSHFETGTIPTVFAQIEDNLYKKKNAVTFRFMECFFFQWLINWRPWWWENILKSHGKPALKMWQFN